MDSLRHGNFRLATLLSVICLGLAIAGCDGDDGDDGPPGAQGEAGLACWDLNENGVPDLPDEDLNGDGEVNVLDCNALANPPPIGGTNPVESCAVCHSGGSIADPAAGHALPPIEAVSNVTFATANGGADLAVTFDLTDAGDAGAPLVGYDDLSGVYGNSGGGVVTRYTDAATLTDNGGGNYTITLAGAGPEAAVDTRWVFRIADTVNESGRTYFYADFPGNPFAADGPLLVEGEACQACHGPEGIAVHGGNFIASEGAEPCLTCHGADDSPFGPAPGPNPVPVLVAVAHGYHSSVESWADPVEPIEPHVTYPSYMNNCSVCHSTEDELTAVNAMPVNAEACFSCHGSTETMFPDPTDPVGQFHAGISSGCETCHTAGGPAAQYQVVTDVHNGVTTERGGIIWDGVDTSVTEGAKIDVQITDVADDGTNLTITWQASYDGVGVNPCNATVGDGAPVFFLPGGGSGGTWSVLRNYAQGQDYILGTNEEDAGQPGSAVNLTDTNTTCSGNVATTVVPVEETDAMYGRVGLQGKAGVVSVADASTFMRVRSKSATFDWVVGVGGAAPPRRPVVDTGLCLNCHVGSLYQHGGNRVDNVDLCYLCHNPAANDQYVRVDGFGVDASESYDGRAGQSFGIKEMLHAVHSAGDTGAPIVIYRGRGIYAWAGSEDLLNNWPTEPDCVFGSNDTPGNIVVGSDPEADANQCQPHNFHTPTYPRGLYDCAACHVENLAVLPDPTKAMATTVDTGEPPFGDQLNDVLEGVTASTCMTCHQSDDPGVQSALKAHAYQNGWVPQEFEEGRQTIIEAN